MLQKMKTTTFQWTWCFLALLLLTTSCQQDTVREVIVYQGDGHNWMMDPDGTNAHKFMPDVGATTLRWSPNDRQVAFNMSSNQGIEIWIANSDSSEPHSVTTAYEDMGIQDWLNNYTLLVRIRQDVTDRYSDVHYLLNFRDGSMQSYSAGVEAVVPSPVGDRWVTWNGYISGLTLYDLNMVPQQLFANFLIDPFNFDISSSGREIVFCGTDFASDKTRVTGMYRWEFDSVVEPTLTYALDFCGSVRWSPDGKLIALLKIDSTLVIFDADTNKVKYKYVMGPLVTSSFVWSPRGDKILVTRHYGEPGPGPKELASVDIETGTITRLTDNDINESSPQWVIIR